MIRLFSKPDLKIQVRTPAFTESTVTGRRTMPSKPFDVRGGDTRWFRTDLGQHFAQVKREMGR